MRKRPANVKVLLLFCPGFDAKRQGTARIYLRRTCTSVPVPAFVRWTSKLSIDWIRSLSFL
jgi:hypothetical protein